MTGPVYNSTKNPLKDETKSENTSKLDFVYQKIDLLLLSAGLIVTFSGYDVIISRIAENYYHRTGGDFIFLISTLLFPINWLVAKAILAVLNARSPMKKDSTNRWWYMGCALSNALIIIYGVTTQFIDSVTNVITSAGPLALMLFVKVLNGKSYSHLKYLSVVPLVVGVALTHNEDLNSWRPSIFDAIPFFCLAMVGVFGGILDRIGTQPDDAPSSLQMMSSINGWGAVVVTSTFVFFNGFEFVDWSTQYPEFLMDFTWLAVVGVLSQFFIYTMVSKYGALSCVMTTTACKVITMLFNGPFVERQWMGLGLTFVALIVDGALLPMS